jgi:hypothetical protein
VFLSNQDLAFYLTPNAFLQWGGHGQGPEGERSFKREEMDVLEKANDGKGNRALFSGIAEDSMHRLCCTLTGALWRIKP